VAGGPSELFDEGSPFLGTEAERLIHSALSDEQESVFCKPRTVQQLIEVTQANALSI
jgi:hypothetical protein